MIDKNFIKKIPNNLASRTIMWFAYGSPNAFVVPVFDESNTMRFKELWDVQPMQAPTGKIFNIKVRYTDDKT